VNYKFRVWDEDEKKFWYFTLQEILERRMAYRGSWDEKILRGKKTQYTGFRDDDGNEIYDGDIVVMDCYTYDEPENTYTCEITYCNSGYYCLNGVSDVGRELYIPLSEIGGSYTTITKKIGNRYENPELIKELQEDE
jgi:uncharacterized phage protein (TIGR01671 family)